MARTEMTLPLDDEVLAAVRARSVRSGRPEYEVVEDALRRYLIGDGEGLDEVFHRIQTRGDLGEDESLDLAYSELRAMRTERDARQAS